ncbi:proteoglycan 4-like [Schistocerca serialis cubense]|uniref:proteoglycan 4-like n=1 Tax=Schistocerca serialis cubense TaxID=2023355 RepID=UPI00214F1015|nr:proteoglycan 4-like [Schistocerca serialis cubense]
MTNQLPTHNYAKDDSFTSDLHSSDRAFILMNKLAHGGSYPGREDDEAAILVFCNIRKAAALPHTRQQELGVSPRASPGALQEFAGPAAAASAGVAPLDSTTQEVDVPLVAPLAPQTQEEPVAALVDAPSCARGNPAVWTEAQSAAETTEMDAVELPDANLAEAERRDIDADDARAPRKRRAVTHDDSDNSVTSDTARPRKKVARASRASTTEAVKTVAGSSRNTAKPRPATKTQRPTRSPAVSRQPDADGFQRGGAAPSHKVHPSTSFAAATEVGPSASSTQRTEQAAGERQQPTAPATASPGMVATTAPTAGARDAATRRRRRRACRATTAASQRTAADTLPRQQPATRAAPPLQPAADVPRQSATTVQSQQAAPVAEAAPAAPAAPSAPDAAELRSLLRSLSQLLEQLPVLVTAVTTALQAGVATSPRHG